MACTRTAISLRFMSAGDANRKNEVGDVGENAT
jgi:hypothetical protein